MEPASVVMAASVEIGYESNKGKGPAAHISAVKPAPEPHISVPHLIDGSSQPARLNFPKKDFSFSLTRTTCFRTAPSPDSNHTHQMNNDKELDHR